METHITEAARADAFAARAKALARPAAPQLLVDAGASWLQFRLGRERYAIASRWVVGIGRPGDLAPVPGTPEHLLGVVNVRGQLLPVFDLRRLFGVQIHGIADMGRLLLLGAQGRAEVGVLADEVDGQREGVVPDRGSPAAPNDPALAGMAADGTLIIDGQALLADRRLVMEDSP